MALVSDNTDPLARKAVEQDDAAFDAQSTTTTLVSSGDLTGVDDRYRRKSEMVNAAFARIGMGLYQWELFVLAGFGWFTDNVWLQGVAIILPQVRVEFNIAEDRISIMTISLYVGLLLGATFWGFFSDVWGRKVSFNLTLLFAGVFGTAAAGAPTFVGLGFLLALVGFFVGGNLPVDTSLFLEFVPPSHQWLLTVLSVFWPLGQLVASLVAWPLIVNFSCGTGGYVGDGTCTKTDNLGWRYTFITLGGLTLLQFILRVFVFKMHESPKYLLAKGRDEEAVAMLAEVAKRNRKPVILTLADLQAVDALFDSREAAGIKEDMSIEEKEKARAAINAPAALPNDTSIQAANRVPGSNALLRQSFEKFSLRKVKALFCTPKMAYSTGLIILLWGTIGLAYPLYNAFLPTYLANRAAESGGGLNATYRNYAIISSLGVPGSLLGGIMVELPYLGRKGTLAISTLLTGVFLFLFTTATTQAAILGYNCASSLTQNTMYAVLYAATAETFPAPSRGTGNGICSAFNRVCGLVAPIIVLGIELSSNAPLYVSASLFLAAGLAALLLPFETRGKANL
ncbi:hypothetical protein PYCC9005_005277 [Savitreella phatthalungensis]